MKSTLIQEEWRPVRGYEGLYDASNFGRVRSLDRYEVAGNVKRFRKGRILKAVKRKDGYLQVDLCKDGKYKHFQIHRLVWSAFNGSIPEGYEINHIDERPWNNAVWNLSLMTHNENINYGKRTEKCSDIVLQLTLDEVLVKEWPSMREVERNGFDQGAVSNCCNGKRKTHKGFKWRKKESV